ncbi:MAG: metallophosphoesterase family protein [Pseudomonadota bacterium]|nr:metallophosphoesterase family protein [Pseudomonadota bacterium]
MSSRIESAGPAGYAKHTGALICALCWMCWSVTGAAAPRGVHLSFSEDPMSSLTAVWFTDSRVDPGSQVQYGTPAGTECTVGDLMLSALGRSKRTPGVESLTHEVVIRDLPSGTDLCYRVGTPGDWSPVWRTHTAPAAPQGFRFVAFGDHGTSELSESTSAQVAAVEPDLVLLAGDVSYANGDQPIWDEYFDDHQSLYATVPLMTALGNHEHEDFRGIRAYRNRLALPGNEVFYSFDYSNVHFLVLDGGVKAFDPLGLISQIPIREWLFAVRDLRGAKQRKELGEIDFIVVMQHFPLYSNHATRGNELGLAAILEPLFAAFDVDMLITGHNHHYERSKPMQFGQPTTDELTDYLNPQGYIQVITGAAGRSLYDFKPEDQFALWSAAWARRYHFVQFDVDGPVMQVEAIATDEIGGVIDQWSLTR